MVQLRLVPHYGFVRNQRLLRVLPRHRSKPQHHARSAGRSHSLRKLQMAGIDAKHLFGFQGLGLMPTHRIIRISQLRTFDGGT